MGPPGAGVGVGVATSLLAVMAAVLAPQQVSCSGQCFRLDGLRLLANMAEAMQRSGSHLPGIWGGGGGGGGALGLRLWLHVPPVQSAPASQALDDDFPEARIGSTRISFDPYRNVLEVEDFPSDLEFGFRDDSPMNIAFDSGKALPMKEVPIERSTILRDLQLMEDSSHPPGHVVVSVNPWSAQSAAVLPQLVVVVRTRSGATCELQLPSTAEGARRLLGHVSQLEARHAVAEIVVLNAELLQEGLIKCEHLVSAEAAPPVPVIISPASVLASWRVDGGGLRLGPQLLALPPPAPPPAAPWANHAPPPPPVQLRACLPHPALQAASVPAYWRKVFAIITGAMSQRLTASAASPNGSADDQPRQLPPRPAVASHRRARRSYVVMPAQLHVPVAFPSGVVPVQTAVQTQVYHNFKSRPPSHVIVDNKPVQVTRPPPNWPFHPGPTPPPTYVWRYNTWVEVVNGNGNWKEPTPSRSLNPPSYTNGRGTLIYVLVFDVWVLLTSSDILWNKATNSFRSPQQLLQYQPNSAPTYMWVNGKLVQVVNRNNQWFEASPGDKGSTVSQNGDQIACVWDSISWVLCKLSDLLTMGSTETQLGSYNGWKPGRVGWLVSPVKVAQQQGQYQIRPVQEWKPPAPPSSGSENGGWKPTPVKIPPGFGTQYQPWKPPARPSPPARPDNKFRLQTFPPPYGEYDLAP